LKKSLNPEHFKLKAKDSGDPIFFEFMRFFDKVLNNYTDIMSQPVYD